MSHCANLLRVSAQKFHIKDKPVAVIHTLIIARVRSFFSLRSSHCVNVLRGSAQKFHIKDKPVVVIHTLIIARNRVDSSAIHLWKTLISMRGYAGSLVKTHTRITVARYIKNILQAITDGLTTQTTCDNTVMNDEPIHHQRDPPVIVPFV